MDPTRTKFTYRRGVVCQLAQTLAVIKDERGILLVLVGQAVRLILGMIVGEQAVRLQVRGRLKVVSLGYRRAHIHGGRDQSGGW